VVYLCANTLRFANYYTRPCQEKTLFVCEKPNIYAWDGKIICGAPGRIRTYDLRLRSPLLYPLSYEGTSKQSFDFQYAKQGLPSLQYSLASPFDFAITSRWLAKLFSNS
jgi:hypothetical protein